MHCLHNRTRKPPVLSFTAHGHATAATMRLFLAWLACSLVLSGGLAQVTVSPNPVSPAGAPGSNTTASPSNNNTRAGAPASSPMNATTNVTTGTPPSPARNATTANRTLLHRLGSRGESSASRALHEHYSDAIHEPLTRVT